MRVLRIGHRPLSRAGALLPAHPGGADTARTRARQALVEARRTMAGVIGDLTLEEPPLPPAAEHPQSTLERLTAAVADLERERAVLRAELTAVREALTALQARLDALSSAEPTPPAVPGAADVRPTEAAAGPSPPDSAGLRALDERVFAAGTVGVRVELCPPPPEADVETVLDRLHVEPLVERAELVERRADAALLRVALRTALPWHDFRSVIERALRRPIGPDEAGWLDGALRLTLRDAGGR